MTSKRVTGVILAGVWHNLGNDFWVREESKAHEDV